MNTQQLLNKVQTLLDSTLEARFQGSMMVKEARARGYADGYMRALIDSGLIDEKTMLKTVTQKRKSHLEPRKAENFDHAKVVNL